MIDCNFFLRLSSTLAATTSSPLLSPSILCEQTQTLPIALSHLIRATGWDFFTIEQILKFFVSRPSENSDRYLETLRNLKTHPDEIKSQLLVWIPMDSDGMIFEGGRVGYENIHQPPIALLSPDGYWICQKVPNIRYKSDPIVTNKN